MGVDKNRVLRDLEAASLADLLNDMAAAPMRPRGRVSQWLGIAGVNPGNTRIPANKLYAEYVAWETQLGTSKEEVLPILKWGKEMTLRIRRGRGKTGNIYYISRER